MQLNHYSTRRALVVGLEGPMNVWSVRPVRAELHELLASNGRDLILNLRGVRSVDSAGLGLLVLLCERARRERRGCAIVAPPPELRAVCIKTGFLDGVRICENEGEALGLLAPPEAPAPLAAPATGENRLFGWLERLLAG